MSGGRFDYLDLSLKNEIFGWSEKCYNVLEDVELSELVWDVLDLLHDYDWYISGDTEEDTQGILGETCRPFPIIHSR